MIVIEIWVNNKHLMLIQRQYNNLILLEIEIEMKVQQFLSLLKKQKKVFSVFHKNLWNYCRFIWYQYKMTQYNTLNVKLPNSELIIWNKRWYCSNFKSFIKSCWWFHDENNFPHKLSLTYTQVLRSRKAFANGSSSNNIKLSKTQLHKIVKSGRFLGRILWPLLKTGLPLMRNILKPPTKSVLMPLELTAAASATDAALHKEMFGFGRPLDLALRMTPWTSSNEEVNDIIKIVKSLTNLVSW